MCYPRPGPRCSGHVRQRLAAVDARIAGLEAADAAAVPGSPDAARARRVLIDALHDREDATRDWHATAAGQRELQGRIAAAKAALAAPGLTNARERRLVRELGAADSRLQAGVSRRMFALMALRDGARPRPSGLPWLRDGLCGPCSTSGALHGEDQTACSDCDAVAETLGPDSTAGPEPGDGP